MCLRRGISPTLGSKNQRVVSLQAKSYAVVHVAIAGRKGVYAGTVWPLQTSTAVTRSSAMRSSLVGVLMTISYEEFRNTTADNNSRNSQ